MLFLGGNGSLSCIPVEMGFIVSGLRSNVTVSCAGSRLNPGKIVIWNEAVYRRRDAPFRKTRR